LYLDYAKISLRSLLKRQLRTWLTMIGIFIGIAAVVSMISLGQGLQQAINEQFAALGADKIIIASKGQFAGPGGSASLTPLTDDEVDFVGGINGVKAVTGYLFKMGRIEFKDQVEYVQVVGIPLEPEQYRLIKEMFNSKLSDGRELRKGDKNKVQIGYNLRYNEIFEKNIMVRDKLLVEDTEVEVVGVPNRIGNPDDDKAVYLPMDTFRDIYGLEDNVDMIIAQVQDGKAPKDVAETVKKDLRRHMGEKAGEETFYVETSEQIIQSFNSILNIVQVVVSGIAGISLVVGGIGIMNTMYTSVLERTKEVGVMKAIGARNSDILLIFLTEAGFLGLAGGVIGVLIGMGLSELVAAGARAALGVDYFQAYFPLYLIFGALAFSFVVGCLSGVLPAMQASRMNPVDSLRYE